MPDNSFDVVSKIELPEVIERHPAGAQGNPAALRSEGFATPPFELVEKDNKILLASEDEFKLKAVIEILEQKLVKRKVSLKGLEYGVVTPGGGIHRAPGNQAAARNRR